MNHLSRFIKTTNFGFPNIPEQVQSCSNKRGGPGVQTPAGGKQTPPAAFPDNWNTMYPAWQLIFRWD